MALDKLVDSSQLNGALGSTADAIRAKTGDTAKLTWDMDEGFSVAVGEIVTLEEGTADATATSGDILNGKTAYVDGEKVTGNIPTKTASDLSASGKTVTVPAGYYATQATKNIGVGTVTSGTATISTIEHTYNSTSGKFDVSGSANVSAPTVGTAGYVSSTEGTKSAKTNGATVSATVNKITGSTALTGTKTKKPSITKQDTPSGVTNAASGNATTTAPTSGVYVAVKSAANTGTITATPSVTSAGYGTADYHGITGATDTVGASASDTTYVPITTTSASVSGKTVSYGSGWIAEGSQSVADGSVTQNTPTVNASTGLVTATSTVTEGYVTAGTPSKTLQLSVQAAKTVTPTESEQTAVSAGKYTTGIVKVGAISSTYVGSDIPQNDSDDLTVSGATVTAPAGYYANNASATIASGSVTQNAPTINTSTGLVTATSTVTAGYVEDATPSNTLQLTAKAAATYNVKTSDQTIAAGTYLTGKQTFRKVTTSGISAANIKDGAVIKVGDSGSATRIANVTGTFTDASTVTSGQTAAAAEQIRSGYSAWVDGAEVLGSLGDTSVTEGTTTVSDNVATRGEATWGNGVITSGAMQAASFANTATEGKTYVDISSTDEAPVLVSGGFLYIDKGYTDDLKISLAKLVPDGASADLASNKILSGYSAYSNDGVLVAGNIASQAAQTIYPKTTDQTVAAGKYLSGTQTFKAVTTSGISAGNIKSGTTIKVGDAADDDRITAVTGTFTKANTVSSGQTAATASQLLSGYSAWVDAAEVKGNIATLTDSDITVDGRTITIPVQKYTGASGASEVTKSIGVGTVTSGTANITSITKTYNSSSGKFDITGSTNVSAPTVGTAGYISSSEGTRNAKSGGATVSATIDKIVATTAITGTKTAKPSITKQDTPSGVTNAASGAATTTAPTSGVYVAVKSAANTGTLTATPSITTAGYGDATNNGITGATATVGASASDTTYVPITTTSASVSGKTVTYGTGWITGGSKSVAVGAVTSGDATIDSASFTYNSTNANFDIAGSSAIGAPTVNTAGYVSSTEGTKTGNTATLATTVAKIAGSTTISGTTTKQPSITKQDVPSGVTQAASGAATTTAPTSGVYVAVKSAANTGTLTATPSVTTDGYGTSDYHALTAGTATVGASASAMTYVPITTAAPTFSSPTPSGGSTATGTNVTLSTTDNGMKVQTAYSVNQATVTYNAAVNGWVTKANGAEAVKTTARSSTNGTAYYVTGVTMPKDKGFTVTTTADTALDTTSDLDVTNNAYRRVDITNAANGTVLVSNTGNVEVTSASTSAGTVTIKAKVASGDSSTTNQDVVTNGLWKTTAASGASTYYGRVTVGSATSAANTASASIGTASTDSTAISLVETAPASGNYYTLTANGSGSSKITKAGWIATGNLAAASTTKNYYVSKATTSVTNGTASVTGGTASTSVTGMVTTSTNTGYSVSASATGGNASVTASSATVGAGYNPASVTASTAADSATGDSASETKYIQKGVLSASVSSNSGGSASMAATGFTAASSTTSYYVTLSTSAGSVKAKASVGTEGYVKTETNETAATSVAVSGNGNKLYVPAGAYAGSVSSHSISTAPVVTGSIGGTVTNIGTTTKPSGTDGTDYWTITPGGSVTTTGKSTAKGKATISTAGYIPTGNNESSASTINITPTVNNGSARYLAKATSSTSNGTATVTGGTASTSVTGMVTTTTNTGYSVTASATGGEASVTASSATVGVGYNPSSVTASTIAQSVSGDSASETKYIQKGVLSASVSSNTGGSASMAATGFTAASSATSYYVTLSTTAGSVKAKAQVGTEGYVKTETNETSATSVAVSGNGNKLYIPAGSTTQNAPTVNASGLVTATSTVTAGYQAASTPSNTLQLDTLGAQTKYATTSDQTISTTGKFMTGNVVVKKLTATNYSAENIKHNVTITVNNSNANVYSVKGSFTSDGTIAAADVRSGKIGYSQGSKITGSMPDTTVTEGTTTVSSGTATRGEWSQTAGYTAARTIEAATFANTATSGTTYVDISSTDDAPVLVSGSSLFINRGYVDNLKISLAKLVPDGASANLASNKILSGYSAYNNDGVLVAGNIASQAAQTITPTTTNQTIASGKYLSGVQTIVGDANLKPENIANGVSIFGITGSYVGIAPSVIETTDTHGGTIAEITTDGRVDCLYGPSFEFVQNITGFDVALADTAFNTWTPSTTNKEIKATANAGTYVADMTQYEYVVEWKCWMDFVYVDGTVPKLTPRTQCDIIYSILFRRPTNLTEIGQNKFLSNAAEAQAYFIKDYYDKNGNPVLAYDGSYGIRAVAVNSTFSNGTANSPTITFKLPSLAARCNTTYMTTAMTANIDKTNSIYHVRGKLYRCKLGTVSRRKTEAVVNLYNERSGL